MNSVIQVRTTHTAPDGREFRSHEEAILHIHTSTVLENCFPKDHRLQHYDTIKALIQNGYKVVEYD